MRQATAFVAIVSIAGLSACTRLLCIACEGHLGATGEVYEWLDAPSGATSIAYIDAATSDTRRLSPLVGAEVILEPWAPRGRPSAGESTQALRQTVTDKDGHFRVGGTVRPGNYKATLSVRATGFQTIEQLFSHDRQSNHIVRVLLVRTK
jgi:hypothetical protein